MDKKQGSIFLYSNKLFQIMVSIQQKNGKPFCKETYLLNLVLIRISQK